MERYDYREAMKQDIIDALTEDYTIDELKHLLNDENFSEEYYEKLWLNDSVTGNASGSYTFSSATAEEYVKDNLPLCIEALENFAYSPTEFGEKVYNEEWEFLDITIRCYLLGECLTLVLEELLEVLELA